MGRIFLVTGGAGHLGNTIVNELAARGERVRALLLPGEAAVDYLARTAERCVGDITDPDSLETFFSVPFGEKAIVLHTAGIVTIASKYQRIVEDVNIGGTRNVISKCEETGARLVYVSSVHAIPERPSGETVTEVRDFAPELVRGLYAQTKASATAFVLEAAEQGLDAVVVHPSGILGPYDHGHGHLTQMLTDYCRGRLRAGVRGGYDLVDVRDVANGILAAAERGVRGECYILSNRYFEVAEMFAAFSRASGRKPVNTMLPLWFARAAAAPAELYYKMLRQTPLYTAYSLETLSGNARFSCEKARQKLGYTTRPFDDTVADTVAWLRAEGRI